ncbi:MAG: SpoIIE family protein phosphatase [Candidatus Baltobacteraceae bacterium]
MIPPLTYLDQNAFDAIPEIAWMAAQAGRINRFNRAWYEYRGVELGGERASGGRDSEWLEAVHPDDREVGRQALGDGRSLGTAFSLELRLLRGDGTSRWFRVQVTQLGTEGWLGICTDIDHYKRQGQRFAFIAKAGEVLAESLDLQTTLERLLAIIVPEFGDWAAIDLFDENGRLKTAAVMHADPAKMHLMKQLLGRYNHDPHTEPRIAEILRENRPMILPVISEEQVEKAAAREFLGVIRDLAPHSGVTIPLRTRGRTIGSLVAYWAETPRRYDEQDLPLFVELTKRAAVSIENARLYETEREIAAEFQRASLPISLPRVAGLQFNGIYVPASDRELLGGDWYDALRLTDGRIVISIGDVAGSGIAAAVIMSSMRQVIRGVAQVYADPIAILDAANRTLKTEHPETFVTAFVGVFDPIARTLTFASAGHPAPLLRDEDGSVTALGSAGPPLGLRGRGETASRVKLPESVLLVFYTDGLIEAERNVIDGEARLRAALARAEIANASNPADSLYRAVLKSGSNDDVVVLTLRLEAPGERSEDVDAQVHNRRWTFATQDEHAARSARHAFVAALRDGGMRDEGRDAAELVFGELLGNVVRYAPGPIDIMFDWSEAAPVLHVLDQGPGFTLSPRLPTDLLSERGRGLFIVWSLAEDFNVTERLEGGSHARAVLGVT